MNFLHTMIRVSNLEESLHFFCNVLGLVETRRKESEKGRFTLVFLAADNDKKTAIENNAPLIELTYNWDPEVYESGRNFGHLAFEVDDIYITCSTLIEKGIIINRPPRDGYMAFIKSPDGISIELLQKGPKKEALEPWVSMKNSGTW
jgi:lactoylglutathione lyase